MNGFDRFVLYSIGAAIVYVAIKVYPLGRLADVAGDIADRVKSGIDSLKRS